MIKKLTQLAKKPFIRNVTVLASGTAMAQMITMIASPIITRIYGPEAFGVMGTFTAMIAIIAPVSALTYPIAIVLPERDKNARGIIKLSIIITFILSMLSLIILLIFNQKIVGLFNIQEIASFLFLVPLVIIFSGIVQVAEQWLIRTKHFTINARVRFLQSIIINSSKIGIGLINPVAAVLVVLSAVGNGLRAFMMIFYATKSGIPLLEKRHILKKNKRKLKKLARKHYDFPLFRAPQVFLDAVTQGLPVLMLSSFFGPASAGFYTIGRQVLRMPSSLIGQAVGDVFYPRIAEAYNNKEDVTKLIRNATLGLAAVGAIPFGLVVLFGPFLFSLVFGADWTMAGEYARWIALFSFAAFINRPSVRSLPVLDAQKFHLFYTVTWLIIRLGLLSVGNFVFSSDLVAIALFGMSGVVSNIGLITITLQISKKKLQK